MWFCDKWESEHRTYQEKKCTYFFPQAYLISLSISAMNSRKIFLELKYPKMKLISDD